MFKIIKTKYFYTVQLFLGYECNLDCKFCFVRNKKYNIPQITYKQFCDIVDGVSDKYYFRNTLNLPLKISITGGEPSLHPDFEKMLNYLKIKNVNFEIYSNGLNNFNPLGGEVRLRYDGCNFGEKPMILNNYKNKYTLGLIINGKNTEELKKCIDLSITDKITLTEMIDLNGKPVCGSFNYLNEADKLFRYIEEEKPNIKKIEFSIGRIEGSENKAPICRWERWFGGNYDFKCPAELDDRSCKKCVFQKHTYIRV